MSTIEQLQAQAVNDEEEFYAFQGEMLAKYNEPHQDTSKDEYEMERLLCLKK